MAYDSDWLRCEMPGWSPNRTPPCKGCGHEVGDCKCVGVWAWLAIGGLCTLAWAWLLGGCL